MLDEERNALELEQREGKNDDLISYDVYHVIKMYV